MIPLWLIPLLRVRDYSFEYVVDKIQVKLYGNKCGKEWTVSVSVFTPYFCWGANNFKVDNPKKYRKELLAKLLNQLTDYMAIAERNSLIEWIKNDLDN